MSTEENQNEGLTPVEKATPELPPGFKAVEVKQDSVAEIQAPSVEAVPEAVKEIPQMAEFDPTEQLPAAPSDAPAQAEPTANTEPDQGQAPWPGLPEILPTTYVSQQQETYYPPAKPGEIGLGELLLLPADTAERMEEWSNARPLEELTTEKDSEWATTLQSGEVTRTVNDQFVAAVDRPDGKWAQEFSHERIPLHAARPRLAQAGEQMLTGVRAVQRVRALMGMGTIIQIPLWESGFWMSLRAPEEGELLDLWQKLTNEKINLGRRTYGLAFANSSSFTSRDLLEFAMRHLHDTTLNASLDPRKFIKAHDLQTIAWGLACTIWPKGFNYSRSVLGGEGQEKVIRKGRLDVSKLQFVDRARLTDRQLSHMTKRTGNVMTQDSLDTYQNEFKVNTRRVQLAERMFMELQVPSADQYITAGTRWVDGIAGMVDKAFDEPPDDESRDRYVTVRGKATVMRQFVHWVKSLIEVEADGREVVFSDGDTIDLLIDTLSSDDEVRKKYFEAIHTFVDDTTVSVIATPTISKIEENLLPRFPRLVPIDAQYTFFTLLAQKIRRIQARLDQ